MKTYLGIDLGGTNIAAGVVEETGRIAAKFSVKTRAERAFPEIAADLALAAGKAAEQAGLSLAQMESVGVGVPSCIDSNGVAAWANNLGWHNLPLKRELSPYFERPLFLGNDADCALLGEAYAGAAKDYRDVLMLTLGTGVGASVLLDGKIFNGADHMGLEGGHIKLVYNGEPCTCGRRGCFEAYASAPALKRQTWNAMQSSRDSLLWQACEGDPDKLSARTPFAVARQGDATARRVVDQYISYLAAGLSSLVTVFRPQAVLIGGGVGNEGEDLLKPLGQRLFEATYAAEEVGVPPVLQAALGNDAGIIGAAMLGRESP